MIDGKPYGNESLREARVLLLSTLGLSHLGNRAVAVVAEALKKAWHRGFEDAEKAYFLRDLLARNEP